MSFRLLLIEDSPTQLLTISKTLQTEGYQVIEARNGAEGLARAYQKNKIGNKPREMSLGGISSKTSSKSVSFRSFGFKFSVSC